MKNVIVLITTLLLQFHVHISIGQQLARQWVQHADGKNFELATDIAIDNQNNLYIVGNFVDTSWFGATRLVAQGKTDIFIAKYDKTGKLLWVKALGGKEDDRVQSILPDNKGGLYICGKFKGSILFEKELIKSQSFADNFIGKFNTQGEKQWITTVSGNTRNEKTLLNIDNNGNLYYSGTFFKQIKLGSKVLLSDYGSGIFISTLDTEGHFTDAFAIGGQGNASLKSLIRGENGELFIAGSFTDKMDFGNTILQSLGQEDMFVARLKGPSCIWAKQAGGYYNDLANCMVLDNNRLLIGGSFSEEALFGNTSLLSEGVLDAFILACDLEGNILWAQKFGGPANEYVNSLLVSNDGSFYLGGSYRGKIQKIKARIESEQFSNDIYFAKFDKDGYFKWTETLGGNCSDFALGLVKDNEGYIYQTGSFAEHLKIGKEKTLSDGLDNNYFIRKVYDCDLAEKVELGDDCTLCQGAKLSAKGEFTTYQWSNGKTDSEILVEQKGKYNVLCSDKFGCQSSDTVEIDIIEMQKPDLGPDILTGTEESIILNTEGEFTSYLWSDGSTGATLYITPSSGSKSQQVTLTVSNEYGCTATDSILINQNMAFNNNENLNTIGNNYSAYPNPTGGKFSIRYSGDSEITQIDIFDIRGNKVKTFENASSLPLDVDLSQQGKGTYLIVVSEPAGMVQFKVVVE